MLISHNWLQEYFDEKLPGAEKLGSLLTMHSFEVELIEKVGGDEVLDIKVLPDRSHDCLSHIGIAREISLLTGLPLKENLKEPKEVSAPESNVLRVELEDEKKCRRFSLLAIENVEVKESPEWLKACLRAMGQRSVNNIVDATNFVMFNIGQPLHAYDRNLLKEDGTWKIVVRAAKSGERLTALDNKGYSLEEGDLIIVDGNTGSPLGIAGIKGGKACEISSKTKHVILEAGNFDPISVRKTSKRLGLRTDASVRFENEITPELTTKALKEVSDLIFSIAKTDEIQIEGMVDFYPRRPALYKVGVSLSEIEATLGITLSQDDVAEILSHRGFEWVYLDPREYIVEKASSLIGTPYKMGSSVVYDAPRGFDCSSFTSFLYAQAGVAIPRISADQFIYGEDISANKAMPGDLVFANSGEGKIFFESVEWFSGTKIPNGVDHVGLYMGSGLVIHATRKTGFVTEAELSKSESFKNIVGFKRILLPENRFVITIPSERLDLRIREDLIEEIGRIYGYQKLKSARVKISAIPNQEKEQYYERLVKNFFTDRGFSEVMTYAFQSDGEVELQNPLASDKGFLRSSMVFGLKNSFASNIRNKDLLGLMQIKVFEMGSVFNDKGENMSLAFVIEKMKGGDTVEEVVRGLEALLGIKVNLLEKDGIYEINFSSLIEDLPEPSEVLVSTAVSDVRFKSYSQYPFILRDIAVFLPEGEDELEIINIVSREAGNLLVNHYLFDVFTKELPEGKKTSYAYRLVFQSPEKTLTDDEINPIMDSVTKRLNSKEGWQVR